MELSRAWGRRSLRPMMHLYGHLGRRMMVCHCRALWLPLVLYNCNSTTTKALVEWEMQPLIQGWHRRRQVYRVAIHGAARAQYCAEIQNKTLRTTRDETREVYLSQCWRVLVASLRWYIATGISLTETRWKGIRAVT